MSTSGTYNFNLSVDEIIEEALSLVNGDPTSAQESREARRALNLLLYALFNKGVPLSKLKYQTVTVQSSLTEYPLSTNVVDVMNMVIRRDNTDVAMERLSLFEYNEIPTKAQTGKPNQYTIDRTRDYPVIYIWPSPINSTDELRMWVSQKIEDVNAMPQNIDMPTRYLPAVIYGLAFNLAMKRPGTEEVVKDRLERLYNQYLLEAFEEDRERANFIITPIIPSPIRYY
jgi:hypothetical protein